MVLFMIGLMVFLNGVSCLLFSVVIVILLLIMYWCLFVLLVFKSFLNLVVCFGLVVLLMSFWFFLFRLLKVVLFIMRVKVVEVRLGLSECLVIDLMLNDLVVLQGNIVLFVMFLDMEFIVLVGGIGSGVVLKVVSMFLNIVLVQCICSFLILLMDLIFFFVVCSLSGGVMVIQRILVLGCLVVRYCGVSFVRCLDMILLVLLVVGKVSGRLVIFVMGKCLGVVL